MYKFDWETKPQAIRDKIQKDFSKVERKNPETGWIYNGSRGAYGMVGVNEFLLLKHSILSAYPEQKKFFVLDIGAGLFGWSNTMARQINSDPDLPNDIEVHLIGLRGETYLEDKKPEIKKENRVVFCKAGSVCIENLVEELKKIGYPTPGTFDLIVSRWTLTHVVDGTALFAQAFYMLRPGTGFYIGDGWRYVRDEQSLESAVGAPNSNLEWIVQQTGSSQYLIQSGALRHIDSFIVKKEIGQTYCDLPVRYLGLETHDLCIEGNESVVRFATIPEHIKSFNKKRCFEQCHPCFLASPKALRGSRKLFEYLEVNNLFEIDNRSELHETDMCLAVEHEIIKPNEIAKNIEEKNPQLNQSFNFFKHGNTDNSSTGCGLELVKKS